MPLFLDIHNNVDGITKEKLDEAHKKDIEVQGKHGVTFKDYWYSEEEGKIFCLCEAPNMEAAKSVHAEAHGGVQQELRYGAAAESGLRRHRVPNGVLAGLQGGIGPPPR